jgi:hypothetical protein
MTVTRYVYGADPSEIPLGTTLEGGTILDGTCLDWRAVVQEAGFDPDDHEVSITRLTANWRGHPAGSLVVTEMTVEGHSFAVMEAMPAGITGPVYWSTVDSCGVSRGLETGRIWISCADARAWWRDAIPRTQYASFDEWEAADETARRRESDRAIRQARQLVARLEALPMEWQTEIAQRCFLGDEDLDMVLVEK